MSRKHFQAIADSISDISDDTARYAAAQALADVLGRFNGRFDRFRFLRACKTVERERRCAAAATRDCPTSSPRTAGS